MATGPTAVLTLRRLGWPGSNAVWVQRWDGIAWSGFSAPATLPSWLHTFVRSSIPVRAASADGNATNPFVGSPVLLPP